MPSQLCGSHVTVRIGLDGILAVYDGETKVAEHRMRSAGEGWVTVPEHHERLWRETLRVERRDLRVYAEVAGCSS